MLLFAMHDRKNDQCLSIKCQQRLLVVIESWRLSSVLLFYKITPHKSINLLYSEGSNMNEFIFIQNVEMVTINTVNAFYSISQSEHAMSACLSKIIKHALIILKTCNSCANCLTLYNTVQRDPYLRRKAKNILIVEQFLDSPRA